MGHSDRTSAADGHILIGGTGRAGTTLLVQYFTALGFDTGFSLEETRTRVDPISHAGLERSVSGAVEAGRALPYVAKSPFLSDNLGPLIAGGQLKVRAFVLPVRDLVDAAESRRSVSRRAAEAGVAGADGKHPGGLLTRNNPGRQEQRLAINFYRLVHTLLVHEVPIHFLRFPDFANGDQRVHDALEPLLSEHGVSAEESDAAFASVVDPTLISDFTQD